MGTVTQRGGGCDAGADPLALLGGSGYSAQIWTASSAAARFPCASRTFFMPWNGARNSLIKAFSTSVWVDRKIIWRLGRCFCELPAGPDGVTFTLGDAHEAFPAVLGLIDAHQHVAAFEARIAADHENNELDPGLFVFQCHPRGASEFERRERSIVLEISAVDHRALLVSKIARRRNVSETRAVVRRCACPHVLSKLMQRVQAVDKDVAFDQNVAGDDAACRIPHASR